MLDIADVLLRSPAALATVLIHEATHARLSSAGILYTPNLRSEVESICVARELEFVLRLPERLYPGKDKWAAQLRTYVEHGPTPRWHQLWAEWDKEREDLLGS